MVYLQEFKSALLIEGWPNDIFASPASSGAHHAPSKVGMARRTLLNSSWTTPVFIASSTPPHFGQPFWLFDLVKFQHERLIHVGCNPFPVLPWSLTTHLRYLWRQYVWGWHWLSTFWHSSPQPYSLYTIYWAYFWYCKGSEKCDRHTRAHLSHGEGHLRFVIPSTANQSK